MKTLGGRACVIVLLVLFFDQILKLWVKTNLNIGDEIIITNWFILHFLENNGFAFGYEFFGGVGKLILTFFRIFAAIIILKWLIELIKKGGEVWFVYSFALIFAGAIGNIIDSVFYGVIFNYSPMFYGKVVDMFYFPLISGFWPDWVPFLGGQGFVFFRPVFNIADSSITIGSVLLLLVYLKKGGGK